MVALPNSISSRAGQRTYKKLVNSFIYLEFCHVPHVSSFHCRKQTRKMVALPHRISSGASRQRTLPYHSVFHDEVFICDRIKLHYQDQDGLSVSKTTEKVCGTCDSCDSVSEIVYWIGKATAQAGSCFEEASG